MQRGPDMPSSDEILRGLTHIAQHAMPLAIVWHIVIGAALAALRFGGWRPARRTSAILLALPLFSVSALAWSAHNPFNGTTFAAGGALLVALGVRLGAGRVRPGPAWAVALGAASIAYGWLYPHFLEGWPPYVYLIAAPTGLLPCPTLAVVLGFTLLGGGFSSPAWSFSLGAMVAFYGLFGVLRLGVWLDVGLLVGAAGLFACALRGLRREKRPSPDGRGAPSLPRPSDPSTGRPTQAGG